MTRRTILGWGSKECCQSQLGLTLSFRRACGALQDQLFVRSLVATSHNQNPAFGFIALQVFVDVYEVRLIAISQNCRFNNLRDLVSLIGRPQIPAECFNAFVAQTVGPVFPPFRSTTPGEYDVGCQFRSFLFLVPRDGRLDAKHLTTIDHL